MPLKKNIYLTGFMGTGKTTAGKIAALRLGIPCLDTDFLVEKKFKSTISRIFLKKGEATFRTAESEGEPCYPRPTGTFFAGESGST